VVRENDLLAGVFWRKWSLDSGRASGENSFFKERSLNVIENKGPLWKSGERSGNAYENKGG
jgi:hypothetical protein